MLFKSPPYVTAQKSKEGVYLKRIERIPFLYFIISSLFDIM